MAWIVVFAHYVSAKKEEKEPKAQELLQSHIMVTFQSSFAQKVNGLPAQAFQSKRPLPVPEVRERGEHHVVHGCGALPFLLSPPPIVQRPAKDR